VTKSCELMLACIVIDWNYNEKSGCEVFPYDELLIPYLLTGVQMIILLPLPILYQKKG
jgi:hypothetical protein